MDEVEVKAMKRIRERTIHFIKTAYIDSHRPRHLRRTEYQNPGQVGYGAMDVLKDITLFMDQFMPKEDGSSWYDQSHNPTNEEVEAARKG